MESYPANNQFIAAPFNNGKGGTHQYETRLICDNFQHHDKNPDLIIKDLSTGESITTDPAQYKEILETLQIESPEERKNRVKAVRVFWKF